MTTISCPIWGDVHKATLHSQWTEGELHITAKDLIDSPRTGGMFRLTEEVFDWIQSRGLSKKDKVNITTWIFSQREQGANQPVVTMGVVESHVLARNTPSSVSERTEMLLDYLVDQTESLGDQIHLADSGEKLLIVTESVDWFEISLLLDDLAARDLIKYLKTRDHPSTSTPMVTIRGHNHVEEAVRNANKNPGENNMTLQQNTDRNATSDEIQVFISHSARDSALARLLVNLLQKSMRLSSNAIRCSSVDGYRLPGGVSTDDRLRIEVHHAKLIIGLITPSSLNSLYVAFELGARWGVGKPMIPLLASGANSAHLGGPLSGINALSCESESQVIQLIGDSATHLGIKPEEPSSLIDEVKQLVQASANSPPEVETTNSEKLAARLLPKATELLLSATKGNNGHVAHIGTMRGQIIRAGQTGVSETDDSRSQAAWLAALNQLEQHKLVEDRSGSGMRYDPTDKGYNVADELRGAEN